MTDPLALPFAKAHRISGVGRDWLRAAVNDGRLPHIRAGRRVLILRADLEEFLRREARDGQGREP